MAYRNWCFTLNNYTQEEEDAVQVLDCKYLVYGREVGESLTPHLQGTISFASTMRLSGVKKLIPRAHWEVTRNVPKSIEYCKKEGSIFEKGAAPLSPKESISRRWELARTGQFTELAPESIKVYEYIYRKYRPDPVTLSVEKTGRWYYGPPGTGKSMSARSEFPGAYIKDPKTVWWDGYNGEETVIIDDFDKYQVSMAGDMKRWLDRYPFQAQYKGGQSLIRPQLIIITSNYHPSEIWDDEITQQAILRRVHITHYSNPFCL